MKTQYYSPKIRVVTLHACSLMAGSLTGGESGIPGEYGEAKRNKNLLFFDCYYDEEEDE